MVECFRWCRCFLAAFVDRRFVFFYRHFYFITSYWIVFILCVCLFDSFFRYDWLLLRFFQPVLSLTHINFLLEFVDLWFENMPSVKNNRIFMFIKAPRYRLVFISLDTYLSLFFFHFGITRNTSNSILFEFAWSQCSRSLQMLNEMWLLRPQTKKLTSTKLNRNPKKVFLTKEGENQEISMNFRSKSN